MSETLVAVIAVSGGLICLFCAITALAVSDVSWHELKDYARGRRQSKRFDDIYEKSEDVLIAAESLRILGTAALVGAVVHWLPAAQFIPPWVSLLGVAVLLVALNVWIPRGVVHVVGTPFLFHAWIPIRAVSWVLQPLAMGIHASIAFMRRLDGRIDSPETEEEAFEDEIRAIVAEGQYDGLLEEDAREMIEGVIDLDDTDVADVMTPKSEMDLVSVDMSWPDLLTFVAEAGRTRVPVYEESPENIVGILYVKDLLNEFVKQPPEERRDLRSLLRPPIKVPKTTHLDDLLQQFLNQRQHLFIVVDEYLNLAGLVTIEDVLEEIVGEILDESDEDEVAEIQIVDENTAICLGRTHVDTVRDELGVELPLDEDYDTLGGFLIRQFGKIPTTGQSLLWHDVHLEVLEATSRRVERVRVRSLTPDESEAGL